MQALLSWKTACGATALTFALVWSVAPGAESKKASAARKPDAAALARFIDQQIDQKLKEYEHTPSPRSGDAEFLRRVYLDIVGVIPPADKAAAFLADKDPAKRSKLVDELLANGGFGRHMADVWQALLLPRTSDNRRLQREPFVKWLEERFNANTPWNELVTELLTATGSQEDNPAVTYFLANPMVDQLTDNSSKLFLGVQLQCAQCHNHPFTQWKQAEYWGMAAFFTKVRSDRVNGAAKKGVSPGVTEGGRGKARLPDSAKVVPAKFFQGPQPKLDAKEPYRPVLAKWLTAADNPFFARAMVNRVWAQFFGRGLVNPVDDMHEGREVSHPELLKELARQFTASGHDVKFLVRAVCNSQAYQRTSKPTEDNEDDEKLFSHMAIKPLTPEQLFDSLSGLLGEEERAGRGRAKNKNKAVQKGMAANNPRAQFVNFFQVEDGADMTEYQAGIPQVLRLMNSPQMNRPNSLVNQLFRSGKPAAQIVEQLYLATLARRPTPPEAQRVAGFVRKAGGDGKAYQDVLWALLNSSEFALNH
jgi:hypothetical protein